MYGFDSLRPHYNEHLSPHGGTIYTESLSLSAERRAGLNPAGGTSQVAESQANTVDLGAIMDRTEFQKILKPVEETIEPEAGAGLVSIREHILAGGKKRVPLGYRP